MRASLAFPFTPRTNSTAKDSRAVNVLIEAIPEGKVIVKRPGVVAVASHVAALSKGMYFHVAKQQLYMAIGTQVIKRDVLTNTETVVGTISAGSPYVSFNCTSQVPYVVWHDGSTMQAHNATTGVTTSVTGPSGSALLPFNDAIAYGMAYLDDSMYVMTASGRIYNSALENPLSWGALDYISKTSEPDGGVGLVKHLNYVMAFGKWSCEFFFDAGNATASPLDRNNSMKLEVGLAHPRSMVQAQGCVFFIGQSIPTGREAYVTTQGQTKKISTQAIERFLNADPFGTVYAYTTSQLGHQLYILTLPTSNITLVYDLDEGEWIEWSSVVGGVEQYFSEVMGVDVNNTCYTLDVVSGWLSKLDRTAYADDSGVINVRLVSNQFLGETTNRLYWHSAEIIGDKVVGNASLRYTDDDYTTWTTARTIDLNATRSITLSLGTSRRRAWEILITGNHAVRLMWIEFNVYQGNA